MEPIHAIVPSTRRPHRLNQPDPPLLVSNPSHVPRQRAGSAAFAAVLLVAVLLAPRVSGQEPWTTKKFMPKGAEDLQNACAGFDHFYYMYHGTPSTSNAGEVSKYATLTDVWTTGNTSRMRPPRWPSRAALTRTEAFDPCAMNACSQERTIHRPLLRRHHRVQRLHLHARRLPNDVRIHTEVQRANGRVDQRPENPDVACNSIERGRGDRRDRWEPHLCPGRRHPAYKQRKERGVLPRLGLVVDEDVLTARRQRPRCRTRRQHHRSCGRLPDQTKHAAVQHGHGRLDVRQGRSAHRSA